MARDHTSRGLRDEASVGPDPRRARELRRLSDLKFRVADGEPDIKGWAVYASTGRELGKVDDLMVDVEACEVVMLDVDLRRGDRHSLVPIRAAWIDHAARRVVLDARELEAGDGELLPGLPRSGALSDDDVTRFNDGYVRAYGDRGVDRDADWRVRRGEEELRFGAQPRADLDDVRRREPDAHAAGRGGATAGAASGAAAGQGAHFEESQRIDRILDAPEIDRARRQHATGERHPEYVEGRQPGRDAGAARPLGDLPLERRESRVDDASDLDRTQAIDPRELDGRVRIEEGGTVDERAPVAGVRYEGGAHEPHDYGRPDERYGAEYGSGRIGFDRVVTRHPRAGEDPADLPTPGARAADDRSDAGLTGAGQSDAPRRLLDPNDRDPSVSDTVRFRRYDDPSRPPGAPDARER